MSLDFTGIKVAYIGGVSFQAQDLSNGKMLPVKVSDEVLQDRGEDVAKEVAKIKYGAGKIEADGSIKVHTADCVLLRGR